MRSEKSVAQTADDEIDRVHEGGDERQDVARRDGHQHVIGAEALLADTMDQVSHIREEHLVEALSPAHALGPGTLKVDRLFVIELGRGVCDADAVGGAERRELDVLREGVEVPAVHALDDARRDHPAGAGDCAARAAEHT